MTLQPAPQSGLVYGRCQRKPEGPSLGHLSAFFPAPTAQLPVGGFQSDFAITQHTVSCLPTPACSSSANFSAVQWATSTPPPVSSESQLWRGGRAFSKFILLWVFCVISGGSGCSFYPLFLYPLEFRLPLLVVNPRLLINSSLN